MEATIDAKFIADAINRLADVLSKGITIHVHQASGQAGGYFYTPSVPISTSGATCGGNAGVTGGPGGNG